MTMRELNLGLHRRDKKRMSKDEVLAKFAKELADNAPTRQDDLQVDPVCSVCDGRGWIAVVDDNGSHPIDCPANCETAQANQRRRYQGRLQAINAVIDRKAPPLAITLEEYRPHNRDQRDAYNAARDYVLNEIGLHNGDTFKRSLVLTGQVGSGKTYLASAIHNALVTVGREVWYMKFGEMIRRVNDCFDSSIPVTPLQVIQALQYVEVLILDDVGRDNVSDATKDLFFDIIDARYDLDLPTVLTTNLTQDGMKQMFGSRLDGRLRHIAHWIRLDGNLRDQTGIL